MDAKTFEKIIINYPSFSLKKDLKEKQIRNIVKHIAPQIKQEDIIAFHDSGLIKKGKTGYVITKDALYYDFRNVKVSFTDVSTFTYKARSSTSIDATFTYKDGRTETYFFAYSYPDQLVQLLQDIMKEYNTDSVSDINSTQQEIPVTPQKVSEKSTEEYCQLAKDTYYNDPKAAFPYFLKAAELGSDFAQAQLGIYYETGEHIEKDMEKALYWYEKAALQNNVSACANLGRYHRYIVKEYKKSAYWYEKAALLGNVMSQQLLGIHYDKGEGVSQDYQKARFWYEKAASNGSKYGCFALAILYRDGKGVSIDIPLAIEYFLKAAELGNESAYTMLGNSYEKGLLGPVNYEKAIEYYQKGSEAGDENAKILLDELQKNLAAKPAAPAESETPEKPTAPCVPGKIAIQDDLRLLARKWQMKNTITKTEADSLSAWASEFGVASAVDYNSYGDSHLKYFAHSFYEIGEYEKSLDFHFMFIKRYPDITKQKAYQTALTYRTSKEKIEFLNQAIAAYETENQLNNLFANGKQAMENKNYTRALHSFKTIYEKDTSLQEVLTPYIAKCYLEISPNLNKSETFFWCKKAAEQGDADCCFLLANYYLKLKNNPGAYVDMLKKAEKSGHPKATELLDNFYGTSISVSKNVPVVISERCIGCGTCESICPKNAITMLAGKPLIRSTCVNCLSCMELCLADAILPPRNY